MSVDASPDSSKSRSADSPSTPPVPPPKRATKRKPGRPSKRASFVTERSNVRPPKAGSAAKTSPRGPSAAHKSKAEATKRRPGRPRKADAGAATPETAVAKRGPGRPRKAQAAEGAPQNAVAKRGPGRPRKDAAAVPVAQRRPGRPRKNVAALESPTAGDITATAPVGPAMHELSRQGLSFVRALLGATQGFTDIGPDDVLSPKEVADLVRAREKEVLAAIESGDLRAIRIGSKWRTTRRNVATWLNG